MSYGKAPPMPMTAQEEKEVHRVFELLSDYYEKSKMKDEIKDLNTWIANNRNKGFLEQTEENLILAQKRIDELNIKLQNLEALPEKKISVLDVTEMLKRLQEKPVKKEVEEMVWEVDENLDGYLDWNEFKLMYNRNITDRTGLEPNRMVRLYNKLKKFLC